MFDGLARRWRDDPPPGFVIAAGITTSAPAVGRLLRVISRLPNGEVVLPGLDLGMADEEWDLLGPVETGDGRVYHCESHPQFQLQLLLDHMGVGREIGRASCRERVCQSVTIWVVAGYLKKK